MSVVVRQAEESDFPAILSLIRELAEFEKSPESVTNSVDLMIKEKRYFNSFVAETSEKEIIGMAVYFFAYYTWVGKSLYLEDIYVKESYRRQQVGAALLRKVFDTAREENCKRVRWQVLDWNENAIAFYRKCGAEINSDWLNCTFDHRGIMNFNI
jgi:GNAT superfamily N-acetyltransferase